MHFKSLILSLYDSTIPAVLSVDSSKKLIQGQSVEFDNIHHDFDPISVYDNFGVWIGVARQTSDPGIIKAERIFTDVQNY